VSTITPIKSFDICSDGFGEIDLPGFGTISHCSENDQRHGDFLPVKGTVMHWTASSNRMLTFDGYHFNIADNGKEAAVIKTLGVSEKGKHLWGRNTHFAGFAYCATADDSKPNYGPGAPTVRQRVAMQTVVAEFCAWRRVDPRVMIEVQKMASNASSIWAVDGTIKVPTVASHQTFAIPDGYGRERWDTGKLLPEDAKAIVAIYLDLKAGKRQFMFKHLF
jgi:hypothetical protein